MKLAIDVYYYENQAKTVGILFKDWRSEKEEQILVSYSHEILPYEPGNFYKRELPCIVDLLKNMDLEIIIDGYVYLDEKGKPGLGYYLYEYLSQEKPVLGVAKKAFHKNSNNYVKEIYRGESIKPLYVTSAGLDLEISAENKSLKILKNKPNDPLLQLVADNWINNWEKSDVLRNSQY